MFNMLLNLVDRIVFTAFFIIGVQLPAFIIQYSQRLSGHVNEAKHQVLQFQAIADLQYQGNLQALISHYKSLNDETMAQTATLLINTIERHQLLEQQLNLLLNSPFIEKIYYFFVYLNQPMAQATLEQFVLAIPLEIPALVTGAVSAFAASFCVFGFNRVCQLCLKRINKSKHQIHSH